MVHKRTGKIQKIDVRNATLIQELWLSVGALLTNAEDPKYVKTATAMCGKKQLANLQRVWKRVEKDLFD